MILLDTHAVVWLASDQDKLTEKGKGLIRSNAGRLYLSVVSAWEISILHKRNRLKLPMEPEAYVDRLIEQHGLNEVPLERKVVQLSVRLPDIHNDPFDRILIALCKEKGWVLLSKDKVIPKYSGIQVVW
ncbi:toxin-antitoxin system, toxin component, PIN family [delta proteobacterium NaphS2]|nr:toxin-antitoxin system, toxin component, PIN family [delta proteobacterium NaphS2]